MKYEFDTWAEARSFFRDEIWAASTTAIEYADLSMDEAFDIWAEDSQIEVREASDTAESDDYDAKTHHDA